MLPVMGTEREDRDLMIGYRDGDVAAFETLYMRHKGPLYRYYRRQGLNEAIAAELFQEVWVRIIKARQAYRPTARFTTYMYRIAHNCLIDHYRSSGRSVTTVDADVIEVQELPGGDCDGPESGAVLLETRERFRAALEALPAEQREAFVLREESGLALADIAAVTGVSAETAKSRLRYAVRKLRMAMADE
ncbi:MAG: RNA polymerase sigma factor [Gammaproteobacteria bacterium]